ncbi:MAG: Gfo/Idh/MocA family oxidoreductase, partial [Candidatus Bathyarchaeota archaeon]
MLGLGIVGCGRVTTMFHLRALQEVEEVTVTAVADLNRARMEEVRRKAGAERGYLDYRELLSDPDIQAVAINTPPRFHEQMVVEALGAEKHVLCEKPLAQSVEGCNRIEAALGGSGLIVLPVHNYAFTPCLDTARGVIQGGEIGEIRRIEARFNNNLWSYGARTNFRMEERYSIVEDILPHLLSVVQILTRPVTVIKKVRGRMKRYRVIDDLSLNLETENGVEIEGSMNWTSLIPGFG